MAYIQTQIRLIHTKETKEQIENKLLNEQWITVIEEQSFYGEMSQKTIKGTRKITINKNFIMEIYD